MSASGKHRRPKRRSLRRGTALAGMTGTALALPLTATAEAQPLPQTAAARVTVELKSAPVESATTAAALPGARKAAPATYTVESGDSLSLIAHEFRLEGGWQGLYRKNRAAVGDNPSLIHPGLELTIRGKKSASTKASSARPSTDTTRASRSEQRTKPKAPAAARPAAPAAKSYSNNLDGWIREALDVMAKHGIPGSYDGIHRNIMRESSGNPQAVNLWDSNAVAGTPSKGLLQVIDPTFAAYHVPGTSMDPYDPVANITAACNYAADRYGSIDNVFGAY